MIINLSNHPSALWAEEQRQACASFGEIMDMAFPRVDPAWDEDDIALVADEVCSLLSCMEGVEAVHVAGEHTLTFAIVTRLLRAGFRCLTSTTERMSVDLPDGKIMKAFKFVRLREYRL